MSKRAFNSWLKEEIRKLHTKAVKQAKSEGIIKDDQSISLDATYSVVGVVNLTEGTSSSEKHSKKSGITFGNVMVHGRMVRLLDVISYKLFDERPIDKLMLEEVAALNASTIRSLNVYGDKTLAGLHALILDNGVKVTGEGWPTPRQCKKNWPQFEAKTEVSDQADWELLENLFKDNEVRLKLIRAFRTTNSTGMTVGQLGQTYHLWYGDFDQMNALLRKHKISIRFTPSRGRGKTDPQDLYKFMKGEIHG
jgi:hypothetical protein